MRLGSFTRPELVFPRLEDDSRESVLRSLADKIAAAGAISDAGNFFRQLMERENLGSTGIGGGVAIPHCKLHNLDRVLLAIGVSERPIDFDAADGEPVRLFFVVAAPEKTPTEHLKTLAAISRWVKHPGHVRQILELEEPAAIIDLLDEDGES
jgi:nitrogen PTS system EIIA component